MYCIVVAVDFSETSSHALNEAIAAARQRGPAQLHVTTVIDHEGADLFPAAERHVRLVELADQVRERLATEVKRAIARDAAEARPATFIHVRVGHVADQIANLAVEIAADLVVVGTHGRRGLRRWVMGSVAEKTVRLAPCPVLVVRPKDVHAMDGVPVVEAACAACVAARWESDGASWWCEEHTRAPLEIHVYSQSRRLDDPAPPAPYTR
jgi:nucleotide-binding universal stress UspA family protein